MLFSVEFWNLSTGAKICYAPGMLFTKNIIFTHSFVIIYQSNLASLQSINVKVYLNKNRENPNQVATTAAFCTSSISAVWLVPSKHIKVGH